MPPTQTSGTRSKCPQRDCVHFADDPQRIYGMCLCQHPEKIHHIDQIPCPLYRMNWAKTGMIGKISLDDW